MINPSVNVFVFGVFNIHHKEWLTYSGGSDRPGELCYNFSISNDLHLSCIVLIVNIYVLTFVDVKLFYSLKTDTTALSDSSQLFTGNGQGIAWVCVNDLLGSGFQRLKIIKKILYLYVYPSKFCFYVCYLYVLMYMWICMCMHVYICMYICVYMYVYICIYVYVCMHVYVYICVYVCVYV